jgi:hypothetical protein
MISPYQLYWADLLRKAIKLMLQHPSEACCSPLNGFIQYLGNLASIFNGLCQHRQLTLAQRAEGKFPGK